MKHGSETQANSAQFKLQATMAAIGGEKTRTELAAEYSAYNPAMIVKMLGIIRVFYNY